LIVLAFVKALVKGSYFCKTEKVVKKSILKLLFNLIIVCNLMQYAIGTKGVASIGEDISFLEAGLHYWNCRLMSYLKKNQRKTLVKKSLQELSLPPNPLLQAH